MLYKVDWTTLTARKNTSAGNGYTSINFGAFVLYVKRYTYEVGGIVANENKSVGAVDFPTGETITSINWQRMVRTAGNAPFFTITWENETLYYRNVSGSTVDPGTITVDVFGVKVI